MHIQCKYIVVGIYIHSFILNIYIAPLQENYSERSPDSSTAKKSSLKVRKNPGDKAIGKIRS